MQRPVVVGEKNTQGRDVTSLVYATLCGRNIGEGKGKGRENDITERRGVNFGSQTGRPRVEAGNHAGRTTACLKGLTARSPSSFRSSQRPVSLARS